MCTSPGSSMQERGSEVTTLTTQLPVHKWPYQYPSWTITTKAKGVLFPLLSAAEIAAAAAPTRLAFLTERIKPTNIGRG